MGIGFGLLYVGMAVGVVAAIAGLSLAGLTAALTVRVPRGGGPAIVTAFFIPFLCAGWLFAVYFGQALINDTLFHRDSGIGDAWYTSLPNGYVVELIDVRDHGRLYDPAIAERDHGTAADQEGTIVDVRTAQVAGPLILGCADGRDATAKPVWNYCFVLDTRTHKRTDYANEEELGKAAAKMGVALKLSPLIDLYDEYRDTWFDTVVLVVEFGVPLLGFIFFCRWIIRLRRRREAL